MSLWGLITIFGYALACVMTPVVLLRKRNNSVATLAWLLAIFSLPLVGTLLFLVFGMNRVARRAAHKQASNLYIDQQLSKLIQYQLLPGEALNAQVQRLIRLTERVGVTRPCFGNRVEILVDTNRTLGLIEQAIGNAAHSIHLEYYIWRPDRTGYRVRDRLIERAREGITVRFLYDGIGSLWLGRKFFRPMREAGIHVAAFLPGASFRERWSINLRNHRKIVLIDGRVGFTGGMNIGDEYLGRNPYLGYWRDTHLRLHGPLVLQLQQVFAEDWFYATGEELTGAEWFPLPEETGDETAQVFSSGPDGETGGCHALMFAAINEADESILLATSYFVPTPALVTALEGAAYRGVRVRLLLSGRSDHPWMITAAQAHYETLLQAGVEIWEYLGGLLHSKTLTIDGVWSFVGSPNFDSRSLHLNFEVGVALYGPRMAAQLEEHFRRDVRHAVRMDMATFAQRGLTRRITEQLLRLVAPIL